MTNSVLLTRRRFLQTTSATAALGLTSGVLPYRPALAATATIGNWRATWRASTKA